MIAKAHRYIASIAGYTQIMSGAEVYWNIYFSPEKSEIELPIVTISSRPSQICENDYYSTQLVLQTKIQH